MSDPEGSSSDALQGSADPNRSTEDEEVEEESANTKIGIQGQEIPLNSLNPEQLQQLHQQLKVEIQQLAQTMKSFNVAADRFSSSAECLDMLSKHCEKEGDAGKKKKILVPLNNSVYMDGYVSKPDQVLVDVGTGYYVQKDVKGASKFLSDKEAMVQQNMSQVAQVLKKKQMIFEECQGRLMKMMQAQSGA